MRTNFLLLLISTVCTLVLCELGVRFFMPQINEHDLMFQVDKDLGWTFIPNKRGNIIYEGGIRHTIQTNTEGYRDVPFDSKNENVKIMVLGDSFVSNISVNSATVFTRLMEEQLETTSVYNFGVNGYGQVQELLVLKKWAPQLKPDIALVLIYLRNDFTDNTYKTQWLYPRPSVAFNTEGGLQISPPSQNYKKKEALPYYYKSHIFRLLKQSVANIKQKTTKDFSLEDLPPEHYICRTPFSKETALMYETMKRLVLEINAYGKTLDIPVVFALAPSLVQVNDELWLKLQEADKSVSLQRDLPNRELLDFAKTHAIEMIDLMPSLRHAQNKGISMYNIKEQHWTAEGNVLVAKVLCEYLENRTK